MILESADVAKLLATIGLCALVVLTARSHRCFRTFARVETEAFGQRSLVVLGVRAPEEEEEEEEEGEEEEEIMID